MQSNRALIANYKKKKNPKTQISRFSFRDGNWSDRPLLTIAPAEPWSQRVGDKRCCLPRQVLGKPVGCPGQKAACRRPGPTALAFALAVPCLSGRPALFQHPSALCHLHTLSQQFANSLSRAGLSHLPPLHPGQGCPKGPHSPGWGNIKTGCPITLACDTWVKV